MANIVSLNFANSLKPNPLISLVCKVSPNFSNGSSYAHHVVPTKIFGSTSQYPCIVPMGVWNSPLQKWVFLALLPSKALLSLLEIGIFPSTLIVFPKLYLLYSLNLLSYSTPSPQVAPNTSHTALSPEHKEDLLFSFLLTRSLIC